MPASLTLNLLPRTRHTVRGTSAARRKPYPITPTFLPGFNFSVDYFNIEVTNIITTFGAGNTVAACYEDNDATACSRINRNALGNLWTNGSFVEDFNINVGFLETEGYDFVGNYAYDLGDLGGLSFNFVGTKLETLNSANNGDCLGKFGPSCGVPAPGGLPGCPKGPPSGFATITFQPPRARSQWTASS